MKSTTQFLEIVTTILGLMFILGCGIIFLCVVFWIEAKLTDEQLLTIKVGVNRQEFVKTVKRTTYLNYFDPEQDSDFTYKTESRGLCSFSFKVIGSGVETNTIHRVQCENDYFTSTTKKLFDSR